MGGNKMWVPTSHWGMGALTLYCMHFGITSQWCIRRTITTPYWGMESLTSHGKALGSLLSTLCAECSHNPLLGYGVTNFTWQSTWKFALDAMCGERKRRCGGQEKSVLSASCWALYRALLTSSVLVSTPLSSIPPSRVSGVPLLINRFSDEGLSFRTWGCQDCRLLSLFVCVIYH